MKRTTAAAAVIRDGYIRLIVHTLDDDNVVAEEEFDIDAYALELASQLLATVVQQKAMGES